MTQKAVTVLISGDGWTYDRREKLDGIDDVECALDVPDDSHARVGLALDR